MLKIWSMKKEQQKADNADALSGKKRKVKAAELRVHKDLAELSLPKTMKLEYADPDDILNFKVIITPDVGYYVGGQFSFDVAVPQSYPHEPPKVRCEPTIYHPNIDLEGKVCLNILREEWKPVLNLNAVFIGLQFLFDHPNELDPLNKDAAKDLSDSKRNESSRRGKTSFEQNVATSMSGGKFGGVEYTRVLID
ncbi:NEDD8-conjugating enzyme Ubc12 [Pestalotiopsis fici W106-1]|uniref:NEDD8-conjugating enzyme UBC12 n=1 Tax=Pestalotiopsis fici (strain W106-1 / CGMCC3.15140) TaxID=1229662 RepID=W3X7U4_PESFW|nr:NEDD8-conjugating enzyme Ubc12 [Pestalotiopsis fici W106-1]ETS82198.1 NEDD8-conjugating enzyme Ubc12 [Pestalotiopsis fici W106-1]